MAPSKVDDKLKMWGDFTKMSEKEREELIAGTKTKELANKAPPVVTQGVGQRPAGAVKVAIVPAAPQKVNQAKFMLNPDPKVSIPNIPVRKSAIHGTLNNAKISTENLSDIELTDSDEPQEGFEKIEKVWRSEHNGTLRKWWKFYRR